MATPPIGDLLRGWRTQRKLSQLDLSSAAGVSTRHLSFVETGRSRPSPELVLSLAEHLDVPLRQRNTMLLVAGFAPRYAHTPLDDPAMDHVRASLQRMLDAHDPYPGVVIDRTWNVQLANEGALRLIEDVPAHVLEPEINVFRLCLHPDGLAPRTTNFAEWGRYLLCQIRRAVELTRDVELERIAAEVRDYPTVEHLRAGGMDDSADEPQLLVPMRVALGSAELSMFTTLTTFGTPQDITLDELCVELFFPADDETEALLRRPTS